ncbi:probable methyltransferase TARBP1 [Palaemon carinicauda]|uniref:probable methyltransferase TARBP1 n=1 Tax=Palaemon carinicauda TaxID=392227 RepID=UPI0035B5D122
MMSVLAELVHLGFLHKETYQECLSKFVYKQEIDLKTCETLLTLIKAWDIGKNLSSHEDESLMSTYADLLQHYLYPQLASIIGNVEAELPNHFDNIHAVESMKGSADGNSEEHLCEILAPKVVELMTVVVNKVVSHGGKASFELDNPSDSISPMQRIHSVIIKVFDLIKENLLQCDSKSFGKCYQQRVKFVSLTFTNLVNNSDFLTMDLGLKNHILSVVEVALAMIESSHDLDVTALLLNLIIRPFLETFLEQKFVISRLWDIVCSFFVIKDGFVKEELNSTGFLILCFMADYTFDSSTFSNIRNDVRFYVIIQFGLIHLDALNRKISQFILKRAFDFCLSCESGYITCSYFFWDDSQRSRLQNSWNELFFLLETLEEKQSHVIRPVLDKLDNLIEVTCTKLIHVSWMLTIFKRIFDHDYKSIRFWGVMKLLKLKLSELSVDNGIITFVNSILISVLSDYSLYSQEMNLSQPNDGLLPPVAEEYGNFLTNMICEMDSECVKYFMQSILENIFDGKSWGGIPLFYILRGLSVIPSTHCWDYDIVKSALIKFEGCLSTQEVSIRSASQCAFIRALVKHMSPETSLIDLCSVVRHFRRKESWSFGTVIWEVLTESIDKFNGKSDRSCGLLAIENILKHSLGCGPSEELCVPAEDVALAICLHFDKSFHADGSLDVTDDVKNLWGPVRTFLSDCHQRPYIDHQKYVWVLKLLINILDIYNDATENSRGKNVIGSCFFQMHDSFSCVVQLFITNFGSFGSVFDIEVLSLYLSFFTHLNQTTTHSWIVKNHYAEMFILCQKALTDTYDFKVFNGMALLEFLWCSYFDESTNTTKLEIAKFTISEVLCKVEEITGRRQIEGNIDATSAAKLQLELTRSCWSCVEHLIIKTSSWKTGEWLILKQNIEAKTLSVLLEAIAVAGRVNVLSVFRTCVELAHIIIEELMWQDVVELLWKASSEFKKCCDLYHSLIQCFSDLLFHHKILTNPEYVDTIDKISQNMLVAAEGVQGIASHMARSLVLNLSKIDSENLNAGFDGGGSEKVIDILLILARFGTVHRKQEKIIRDTITYIRNCPAMYSTNLLVEPMESDQQARAIILRYFLSLDKCNQEDRALAGVIYKHLKQMYSQYTSDRRDFANSQKHRFKSRLLQVFMILLPLLSQVESCDALEWLCEGLIKENQQPSIRYMQEWGVSLIIIYFPEFFGNFNNHLQQGTKKRAGCVGSFLASLTHIACTSEDKHLLKQSIECVLPWCMAQHFNTRLYAQVSLRKIWQYCENKRITEISDQFRSVQQCLQFVAEQGNAVRNTMNMLNDFYFKVFHPLQHYTLQTIFYDLPCLSLLSDDEWLAVDSLLSVINTSILPVKSILPLYNVDNLLAESIPAPWVIKAVGETSATDELEDTENPRSNFQRKMTPWKSMMPELSSSLGLPNQKSCSQRRGGLIVVASLIDKTPNLGGLCRTCEVFSVKEYVVSSLAIQEDHNFNSLSLTAQQWVPMKEVKPEDLPGYLRGLQREGYTLVAAEQTGNSKLLSEYEFPERTVVVLGNEREGIPCDLLQLLDVCVEIPQSGIIRSLNVHVSGALFVWEYTRQHRQKLMKQ